MYMMQLGDNQFTTLFVHQFGDLTPPRPPPSPPQGGHVLVAYVCKQ